MSLFERLEKQDVLSRTELAADAGTENSEVLTSQSLCCAGGRGVEKCRVDQRKLLDGCFKKRAWGSDTVGRVTVFMSSEGELFTDAVWKSKTGHRDSNGLRYSAWLA